MISDSDHPVCEQMQADGLVLNIDGDSVDGFLRQAGLQVLFFTGPRSVRREAHDVAVALRELLKQHAGSVHAGLVAADAEAALQTRFRVGATPCLVFLAGGEVLELMPRVRDWADYADAFRRYLGDQPLTRTMRASA